MNKTNYYSAGVPLFLLVCIVLVTCAGCKANPTVVPPTTKLQGLTYGEWLGKWWQYALMLPAADNPLSGETGNNCVYQREGNVGLILANSTLNEPIDCEVPKGMTLFIEVLGAECSTVEEAPFFGGDEEELYTCAQAFIPQDLQASIDGVEIKDLDKYIAISPMYEFTVPDSNILAVPAGTTGKSIGSGAYLLVSSLSAGKHTIHVRGTYASMEYTADKTINLTVIK